MFTKHDIPIYLIGCAIIWGTAWIFDPSSLVLHLVTYAVIAGAVSAHYIWMDVREDADFQLKWRKRRREGGTATKGS